MRCVFSTELRRFWVRRDRWALDLAARLLPEDPTLATLAARRPSPSAAPGDWSPWFRLLDARCDRHLASALTATRGAPCRTPEELLWPVSTFLELHDQAAVLIAHTGMVPGRGVAAATLLHGALTLALAARGVEATRTALRQVAQSLARRAEYRDDFGWQSHPYDAEHLYLRDPPAAPRAQTGTTDPAERTLLRHWALLLAARLADPPDRGLSTVAGQRPAEPDADSAWPTIIGQLLEHHHTRALRHANGAPPPDQAVHRLPERALVEAHHTAGVLLHAVHLHGPDGGAEAGVLRAVLTARLCRDEFTAVRRDLRRAAGRVRERRAYRGRYPWAGG